MLSQWFGKRSSCVNEPRRSQIARTMRLGFDHLEDRSVPAIITISHVAAPTPANNDFTVFKNALNSASAGSTIKINGTLNWSEPNSFSSWASTGFAYAVPHVDDITLTGLNASGDGITGPGTEGGGSGPIYFDGLGTDKNWNITGLTIKNFDIAIFYSTSADPTSYAGTHITNNVITVPNAGPASQNGGIILGPGVNQTVQGNQITISGNGGASSSSFGINAFSFHDAGAWNNLLIDNNTVTVGAAGATEKIIGIAENTGSTGSNITVTNNTFHGNSGSLAGNQQVAFGITSDSTDTATVVYSGNVVNGALDGFVWGDPEASPPYDFSNDIGITFSNTTLTNVGTGFMARDGAKATIGSTTITNTGAFNFGTAFSADGAGTVITVTDPVSNSTGVAALKSETNGGHVNFVGPKVTGLSTTTVNGTYGIGSAITITVTFDKAVSVTGTPTLLLNSGGTATYCGGTGTSSLKFKYTIAAGESSAALDAASASALSGTITQTGGGTAPTLTLPDAGSAGSLSASKTIAVKPADHLAFVTATQTLTAGVVSTVMTVQLRNAANGAITLKAGAQPFTVTLGSSSAAGSFRDSTGVGTITTLTFNPGDTSKSFTYYDTKAAKPTLTVSGRTLSVQQIETVKPAAANHLAFSTQPRSVVAGAALGAVVQVFDQFNNLVPSIPVTLKVNGASTSGATPVLTGTAATSNASGIANFSASNIKLPGVYSLTASMVVGGHTFQITSSVFTVSAAAVSVKTKSR